MKLRNKKTGEIVKVNSFNGLVDSDNEIKIYDSLAELNKDWEDYREEPHIIDIWEDNCICDAKFGVELKGIERAKECGLYFETKEEAEKAVEKLKAWKRLEENGFRFKMWEYDDKYATEFPCILIRANKIKNCEYDLDLLFGGEK